jgi:trimeric autotransporter adhesin
MAEIVRRPLRIVALVSLLLGIGLASPRALADQRVGIDSAVNPNAMGIPPGGLPRRLVLGQDVVFNERITTEAEGQTQILFVDESTLSVGPNANMVIDQFVYDPNAGAGKFAASLTRGVFRFVGGKLSKQENAVTMRTPTATIGIRGGVMLVDLTPGGKLSVIFVYGKGVTITGLNGASQTITRPGFEVTVSGPGASPSDPAPAPPRAAAALLAQLDGRAGGNGGAPIVPTEVTVANSGVANAISANLTASIQAAAHTQPPAQQTQNVSPVVQLTQLNNQNVSVPGATVTPAGGGASVAIGNLPTVPPGTPIVSSATGGGITGGGIIGGSTTGGSPIGGGIIGGSTTGGSATGGGIIGGSTTGGSTTGGGIIGGSTSGGSTTGGGIIGGSTTGSTTTGSTTATGGNLPVMISVAGLAKNTNGPPTVAGFIDQSVAGRVPYTSGTITYPPGSVPQNGTFTASIGGAGQVTLSPLTPGSTNAASATSSTRATAAGTATMTADGNFFYANLVNTTPGSGRARLFVFGGVPVSQSFYAPTSTKQFYAFAVQPDGALGSGSKPQTIPFLPSNYGGTMPNATVSPLYLATIANQSFGNFNATTNPSGAAPHYLQASLAVNGQGANQSSALVVMTGGFDTSNAGTVYGSGPVRGVVFTSATAPLVRIGSGSATVPDGNGNNLFGGNTLSGFVLDQNQYNNGNFSLNLANAFPDSPAGYASGGTNYAFNQPVTGIPLPSNVGVTRSALNEAGYFGGIMQLGGQRGTPTFYILTGGTYVQTFPSDNRVAATFGGTDPFTQSQSRLSSMVLEFGNNTAGLSNSRTTFIDNNIYAALENPNVASQITTTNGTTTTLPTQASGSTLYPRLAMVTSATVPNTGLMPPAGSGLPGAPCSCQYLQWGYWTGQVGIPNTPGASPAYSRLDSGAINTWVAGQPTVNLPTTGMGTYNGAAVGTVFNGGATYLAAGGFNQMYDFAHQKGIVNITNFDGASYQAHVVGGSNPLPSVAAGSGNLFGGALAAVSGPANRGGIVLGSFYGPAAQEAGGSFNISNVQAPAGSKYLASGIFAGKQLP